MNIRARIDYALGNKPADLVLTNAKLVNVFSGDIHETSIAVSEGLVVGFGDYEAKQDIDLKGRYVIPGLIDGHLHLESSMMALPEFSRNVVPCGTTAVVADPHEIANVLGVPGIRYILESSKDLPLSIFIMVPSCVPATPFETSGAKLEAPDMREFLQEPQVLGLAEMMNFPGVLFQDPEVMAKLELFADRIKDGHAPGLSGKGLCAYVIAGIGSDHECTNLDEAREKLRLGMHIMIREGSAAKNLDSLLPLVNAYNSRRCMFVTDDLEPSDILDHGHLNSLLRKAVSKGLDPITAVQMATINPATYFGLKNIGAILPGYDADLLVVEDLKNFIVQKVFKRGSLVAENGKLITTDAHAKSDPLPLNSVRVNWEMLKGLDVKAEASSVNVIQVVPGQIVTKRLVKKLPVSDGKLGIDTDNDVLKIAVIERHTGSGTAAVGFISGFGLKKGAIASTVAHDSHNIIIVGTNDEDIMKAARHLADTGGGYAVVADGEVLADLPLPIAGLMSNKPIDEIRNSLEQVDQRARELGCTLENPFATLSFMALTPIPELKLTDQGLFDSSNFKFVSLFDVP